MEGKLVGIETFFFVCVEKSLREGILSNIFIGFVSSESHFNRLHEPDVDEVLVFDLFHEVVDHFVHVDFHGMILS